MRTLANRPGRYARPGETVDATCGLCGGPIRCDEYLVPGPAGRWHLEEPPPEVAARARDFMRRHPGITITPGCRRAVWVDDSGPQELTYANPLHLVERLEAEFDRPHRARRAAP